MIEKKYEQFFKSSPQVLPQNGAQSAILKLVFEMWFKIAANILDAKKLWKRSHLSDAQKLQQKSRISDAQELQQKL